MDDTRGKDLTDAVGQLLAVLAHEVRNPLGNMNNAVTLLQREPQNESLVLNCAQIMKRQIGRIARLIDDLFDVSVLDQGKMRLEKEPVSVNQLMTTAVDDSSCELETKNHNFSIDLLKKDVKVNGDFARLLQVFCNLLSNAAKYTPDGGNIHFASRIEEDQVVLSIQDNGIGIEEEALQSIFNLFSQELRAAGKTGLGLGLALVKRLVETHDGRVFAHSSGPGKGSRFEVQLPIHSEPDDRDSAVAVDSKRVLLIEDNEDSATALKAIIEMEGGHEVRTSGTGQEGIQNALVFLPEVVLLDLGLPDMSGEIVGRILRKRIPNVCIVAMTGYSEPETDDGWFDHYMTKPVNFTSLFRILSDCHVALA